MLELARPRPFRGEFLKAPCLAPAPEWPAGPVSIEIGCGVGWHPIQRARANPGEHIFALERTHERFAGFERRLRRHAPIPNLEAVHADARAWITHYVPPSSVDAYWILYPNPYPKTAQASQRWHRSSFAERLVSTLKPGGSIHLATNLAWYAEEAESYWAKVWGLSLILKRELQPVPTQSLTEARTHFERKYLQRGEICYDLVLARSESGY